MAQATAATTLAEIASKPARSEPPVTAVQPAKPKTDTAATPPVVKSSKRKAAEAVKSVKSKAVTGGKGQSTLSFGTIPKKRARESAEPEQKTDEQVTKKVKTAKPKKDKNESGDEKPGDDEEQKKKKKKKRDNKGDGRRRGDRSGRRR